MSAPVYILTNSAQGLLFFHILANIYQHLLFLVFLMIAIFVLVWFFMATPAAYGSSQVGGQIGARAASVDHSHSNWVLSRVCDLYHTQLMAMLDPQPSEQGQD